MNSEQLAAHVLGLGGSDAAAALGLSPWQTPLQLYLRKTEPTDRDDPNEAMRWGTALEPAIRQRYADDTGRVVEVPKTTFRYAPWPVALGHVDGVADGQRLLEVKTARSDIGWGEPGSDVIPEHYAIQVQHYLMVTGLVVADVAVLIAGQDYRCYEVPADAELQGLILDGEQRFWRHVINREPPDPTTPDDVRLRWRTSTARKIEANQVARTAADILRVTLSELKRLEAQADDLKAEIQKHMQDADTLVSGDVVLATWKQAKGANRFDLDRFKREHADLYAAYLKQTEGSRRFLLKGTKDE
jgi:putative phage-type endonuclease